MSFDDARVILPWASTVNAGIDVADPYDPGVTAVFARLSVPDALDSPTPIKFVSVSPLTLIPDEKVDSPLNPAVPETSNMYEGAVVPIPIFEPLW